MNSQDYNGDTVLHMICSDSDVAIFKYLLDKGADVNKLNYGQHSPLYMAVSGYNEEIIKLFLEYGADPYITTYQSQPQLITQIFSYKLTPKMINLIESYIPQIKEPEIH